MTNSQADFVSRQCGTWSKQAWHCGSCFLWLPLYALYHLSLAWAGFLIIQALQWEKGFPDSAAQFRDVINVLPLSLHRAQSHFELSVYLKVKVTRERG